MTKSGFRSLFLQALDVAAKNAEERLAKPISRAFLIELHAPRSSQRLVSVDEAVENLYLGDNRFYRVIDVGIKELRADSSLVFVRVSGHAPADFDKTWEPSVAGPFKQILATAVEDRRSQ